MLLDGYIRVSQVGGRSGERFISPGVQREQIEAWTSANGAVLGEVFEELDESGGRADRPLLMRALERVENEESEGIIVAKLDRFGRSVVDGLAAIARIEAAGGTFVSVQDGLDLGTPTGKLVLRIMFSMGEWELDRVRANWDAARRQAIARGVYLSAVAPLGYRRGGDGRLRPEAKEAAVIAEAFRRRGGGATSRQVAAFMNESNISSHSGRPFSAAVIYALIRNPAYRGEARSRPYSNPHAHRPIVDAASWQQAQLPPRRAQEAIDGLLLGLIRCAGCGRLMGAMRPQSRGSASDHYRCIHFGAAPSPCSAPAVARADEIEPLIEELIFALARRWKPGGSELEVGNCEAAVEAAEGDLARYRDNPRLARTLGMASFEAGVSARQRLLEAALLELARARRALQRPRVELERLEGRWKTLERAQRRVVLAELLDCVVIERGKRALSERSWICRRGRGSTARDWTNRPEQFDPKRVRAQRLRVPGRWSQARIERELGELLGGETRWPAYARFEAAGCARLHMQVMGWGGSYFWAHRLGLTIGDGAVLWNAQRVEGALAPLLRGREDWPKRSEFEAVGLGALWRAVPRHGGVPHWADQFGLRHSARERRWSKARVEGELRGFLEGRETFPTKTEFLASGRGPLYAALRGHGGQLYWAEQFGLEPNERRRG